MNFNFEWIHVLIFIQKFIQSYIIKAFIGYLRIPIPSLKIVYNELKHQPIIRSLHNTQW